MRVISLQTASALTGRSERTLWRRVSDRSLLRGPDDLRGRAMLDLESVAPMLLVHLTSEDLGVLQLADAGDAVAQNDIALLFLEAGRAESAKYLFEMVAKQGHPDAMHWLGRCAIEGNGTEKDTTLGLSWLTRAAAAGHVISKEMVESLVSGALRAK